jgi:hypothetical protein
VGRVRAHGLFVSAASTTKVDASKEMIIFNFTRLKLKKIWSLLTSAATVLKLALICADLTIRRGMDKRKETEFARHRRTQKNGADFGLRRSVPRFSPGVLSYFFAFLPVGTVAMVCRMRPAIL